MQTETPVFDTILRRRSIREFTSDPVEYEMLQTIVTAGCWAPSGLNNQPWRFVLIQDKAVRARLSSLTSYSHIIQGASALIAVYLEIEAMYDEVKDHQGAGACIQNMLLCIEELELGGVWLGQILKNKKQVNDVLGLDDRFDLMALLAIGHPLHRNQQSQRKSLSDFILKSF
jgi:nitroreductase